MGQLGWVKFVPIPPSKGFGKGELVSVGALSMDVPTELEVVFVALLSCATTPLASARRWSVGSGAGRASHSISPILPIPLDLRIRDAC